MADFIATTDNDTYYGENITLFRNRYYNFQLGNKRYNLRFDSVNGPDLHFIIENENGDGIFIIPIIMTTENPYYERVLFRDTERDGLTDIESDDDEEENNMGWNGGNNTRRRQRRKLKTTRKRQTTHCKRYISRKCLYRKRNPTRSRTLHF